MEKIDVVLIQPRDPVLDIQMYEATVTAAIEMPPIGLLYIATVLKCSGYKVKIIDFNIVSSVAEREKVINDVINCEPRIIGISTTTPTYPTAVNIAKQVRRSLNRKTKIVLGGYHVTALPDEPLKSFTADIVVRGEGEEVMLKLTKFFIDGRRDFGLSEIEGVSYIGNNGQVVHNSPKIIRLHKLDKLPFPDRNLINIEKYRSPATIISSRGCPARCIFCAAGTWGTTIFRSAENVVDEIEFLVSKYGFKNMYFVDNTFTVDKRRTMKMLALMKERNIKIGFTLETRAPTVDQELIEAMAKAGCIGIQFGVESGNQEILKKIKKGIKLDQVDKTVELCLKYGIKPLCSFMIGHPFDTRETVRDTINYAKKLKRKGALVAFAVLEVYPGTEIFNKSSELGVKIVDWDFSKWTVGHVVIETRNLSRNDLIHLNREAISEVYSI